MEWSEPNAAHQPLVSTSASGPRNGRRGVPGIDPSATELSGGTEPLPQTSAECTEVVQPVASGFVTLFSSRRCVFSKRSDINRMGSHDRVNGTALARSEHGYWRDPTAHLVGVSQGDDLTQPRVSGRRSNEQIVCDSWLPGSSRSRRSGRRLRPLVLPRRSRRVERTPPTRSSATVTFAISEPGGPSCAMETPPLAGLRPKPVGGGAETCRL